VIVVVGFNPNKNYPVPPHDRAELTRRMLQDTPASNVRVQVVKGYIWRHVKGEGALLFVRGIRSWRKDGVDERSLQILNTWGPLLLGPLWWPLPTIFLEGKPEYNHVSSTLIRDICKTQDANSAREELSRLVPRSIVTDVARLYGTAR
jgi:phosphopantetheine adenylyltransferase